MSNHYEVSITKTAKTWGPQKTGYHIFDHQLEKFNSISEIRDFLKNEYGKCKKSKVYRDVEDGKTEHTGWVYHFKEECDRVWRQDWVTLYAVTVQSFVL